MHAARAFFSLRVHDLPEVSACRLEKSSELKKSLGKGLIEPFLEHRGLKKAGKNWSVRTADGMQLSPKRSCKDTYVMLRDPSPDSTVALVVFLNQGYEQAAPSSPWEHSSAAGYVPPPVPPMGTQPRGTAPSVDHASANLQRVRSLGSLSAGSSGSLGGAGVVPTLAEGYSPNGRNLIG
jgi:hypothetical protein